MRTTVLSVLVVLVAVGIWGKVFADAAADQTAGIHGSEHPEVAFAAATAGVATVAAAADPVALEVGARRAEPRAPSALSMGGHRLR
jgi:hypothetical protein